MENMYAERVAAIREMMARKGWDAVVITGSDPHASEYVAARWHQVEWISGYDGEGDLVITADHAGLWTDTRYFIRAGQQLPGTGIELHKTRVPEQVLIPEWLVREAFHGRSAVIAVDGESHASQDVNAIRKALCSAGWEEKEQEEQEDAPVFKIVNAPNLMDAFWTDRPQIPSTPILTLSEEQVGWSRIQKLNWLRKFLIEKDCDAILLTALDEIAWTLNVRGSDVDFNPVVMSYLLITMDEVNWFVKKGGEEDPETSDSFYELRADGISIRDYSDISLELSSLANEAGAAKLYVDPSSLNWNLCCVLKDSPVSSGIIAGKSPVPLRKAIKNKAEIAGMKEAHLEDGIAMEKFFFWLERAIEDGEEVSEWDAALKLRSFRAEIPGYRGDSFETTSAWGEGAALPHYVTPKDGSTKIGDHGLYLCDSGGQYLFGTTDITRTVPVGPCTHLEKEDYTLVLKGHIDLAMSVFPRGTAGCQLDAMARMPLWQAKRNFGHGTGHGVGFYLNVHEGPQDIRQNFNTQAILPGMITSNEPGIYREGMHGVRHENLVLCVEDGKNAFGDWLRFENLTLCHFDTSAVLRELLTDAEVQWLNSYNAEVFRKLSPRLPEDVSEWLREKTEAI